MVKMICRLCLCDLDLNDSVPIFSGDINEYELPKVIEKYLKLEVSAIDPVSTSLCTRCWQYLRDFEQFCIMVAAKQQALQLKTELPESEPEPEPAVVVWNTESIETKLTVRNDTKDHILCEPEIDAALHGYSIENSNSHDDCSSDEDECDRFEQSDNEALAPTAPISKQPKQKARQGLQQSQAKDIAKYEKRKQSRITNRVAAAAVVNTLRESRALKREQRRNETELPAEPEPEPDTPHETEAASPAAKAKRGRPKGPRQPKTLKSEDPELEAKRSTIKEMDEYIAANVKLDCCLCAAPLRDFADLKRHFRAAHNCTGYMQCCSNRYKKRTLYVDHLHYHKNPEYFSCKSCSKNFLNRNSQDMHMLRFHSEQQELIHQCALCEARFAKKFLLTMHLKGHKGTERPEACETCSKTFRTKLELTAHVKRMHTTDFTPVICDICGVNFRSKANFLIHKKALHPEGPVPEVQCHLCGRWLRDERSLRKHLARHDDREGNNKYRCQLCGAEKSSRVALGSHMRYHHSAKRHKCALCDKEFKLPRALAEHMATHTGVDLYSCPFCTRTFKSHANMHNHKKKMHPNEWVRKYTQPSGVVNAGATVQSPTTQCIGV